jgi:hypothetical protein
MVAPTTGWESLFIDALRMHLNVVIPVAILLVKVFVRIFSREEFKEVLRTVTNVPLELLLIAMSFMFGALSGIGGNYMKRFPRGQSDADLYAALVIMVIFFLCILINKCTQFVRVLSGKLMIAFKQYTELSSQPALPGNPGLALSRHLKCRYLHATLSKAYSPCKCMKTLAGPCRSPARQ